MDVELGKATAGYKKGAAELTWIMHDNLHLFQGRGLAETVSPVRRAPLTVHRKPFSYTRLQSPAVAVART